MERINATGTLVALYGAAGAGKDSLAAILVEQHGFTRLAFASVLKDVVAVLFGWPREALEGTSAADRAWRERPDAWWQARLGTEMSPRRALQDVGILLRQHMHPDLFVAALERQLAAVQARGVQRVVITDVRYENEFRMLRGLGARLVHVRRPDAVAVRAHASEDAWKALAQATDEVVDNTGTLEDLQRCAQALMHEPT